MSSSFDIKIHGLPQVKAGVSNSAESEAWFRMWAGKIIRHPDRGIYETMRTRLSNHPSYEVISK
jgi:hypothetical protein